MLQSSVNKKRLCCQYRDCKNVKSDEIKLFHFPAKTDPRCEVWITNSGNGPYLRKFTAYAIRRYGLCFEHFWPEAFWNNTRKRLRPKQNPIPYAPAEQREINDIRGIRQKEKDIETRMEEENIEIEIQQEKFETGTKENAEVSLEDENRSITENKGEEAETATGTVYELDKVTITLSDTFCNDECEVRLDKAKVLKTYSSAAKDKQRISCLNEETDHMDFSKMEPPLHTVSSETQKVSHSDTLEAKVLKTYPSAAKDKQRISCFNEETDQMDFSKMELQLHTASLETQKVSHSDTLKAKVLKTYPSAAKDKQRISFFNEEIDQMDFSKIEPPLHNTSSDTQKVSHLHSGTLSTNVNAENITKSLTKKYKKLKSDDEREIMKMRRKIVFLQQKLKAVRTLRRREMAALKKKKFSVTEFLDAHDCPNPVSRAIVTMQLRNGKRPFNADELDLAKKIYHFSAPMYRYLRNVGVKLPAPSSMRHILAVEKLSVEQEANVQIKDKNIDETTIVLNTLDTRNKELPKIIQSVQQERVSDISKTIGDF